MSRRLTRRIFLNRAITTTLGIGALRLSSRAAIDGALGEHSSELVGNLSTDVNMACPASGVEPLRWRISAPPPGAVYHGVYPGHCDKPDHCDPKPGDESGEEDNITLADLLSYSSNEHGVGSDIPVAWVYFSHNWGRNDLFPEATARWIRDQKSVPFIRLMLRKNTDGETCKEKKATEDIYTLEKINAGCFDEKLRTWGQAASAFGTPLIVEWGTEVNGCWFHWNGKWHGKESGTSLFRNAFRRIVRVIRDEAGASNIMWVFHANGSGEPDPSVPGNEWNQICRYYPGDEFVDWIGLSVYGAHKPKSDEPCVSFEKQMNIAMRELGDLKTRKPLFVLEFGATGGHPGCGKPGDDCEPAQCDAAQWADDALKHLLSNRWPEVRGFSWWNEAWKDEEDGKQYVVNMRVQSVPNLKEKFQSRLKEKPGTISCPIYEKIEARPTQLRLLVPAYFDPGGSGAKYWDALITAARDVEVVAIANPNNGPGSKSNDDYKRYIEKAAAHGVTVLGYVRTNYGKIPVKEVDEDIRRWLDWYEPVSGVFFDEQTADDKDEDSGKDMISHYRELFDHARKRLAKRCGGLIISNPGTVCSERYLTEARADVLCLYESPEKREKPGGKPFRDFTPPAWMKNHKPHHFASLVLQVESVDTMKEYLRKAASDGFGYAYMTERPPRDPSGPYCAACSEAEPVTAPYEENCNPWDRLPTYWLNQVESAQSAKATLTCS
jgi:Spherulation-specific family 4/Glycosyl hydrolase family 26